MLLHTLRKQYVTSSRVQNVLFCMKRYVNGGTVQWPLKARYINAISSQTIPILHKPYNQKKNNRNMNVGFVGLASLVALCNLPNTSNCEDDSFRNKNEILTYLKSELAAVRKKHPQHKLPFLSFGQDKQTFIMSFSVHSSNDSLQTCVSFLSALKEHNVKVNLLETKHDHNNTSVLTFSINDNKGSLSIQLPNDGFDSEVKVVFYKDDVISKDEIDCLVNAYEVASVPNPRATFSRGGDPFAFFQQIPGLENQMPNGGVSKTNPTSASDEPEKLLESLGAKVYMPNTENNLDWDMLAGYKEVKQEISDTVLLAIKHPDVYEKVAKNTRMNYESNRPNAVLFEGPPGTGKTTAARIISVKSDVPMVYLPIESVVSKWYGESEQNLSKIFDACEALGDSIVFLDEIDALATSRDTGTMHEATRRVLSVLLRKLDGFDTQNRRSILIAATNRKVDLDAALLSRFDTSIDFGLPNAESRQAIFGRYAKQLTEAELRKLALISNGLSGRDIKDVCEQAERRWASYCIRNKNSISDDCTPTFEYYENCTHDRSGTTMQEGVRSV